MNDNRDETLLTAWALSKGVNLSKVVEECNKSVLEIYQSAKNITNIDMTKRTQLLPMMEAFCALLYKKFYNQLNRKLKVPKTIGITATAVESLETLEKEKAKTAGRTTFKVVRRVLRSNNGVFVIGDQTIQNFIGCGFFPIGFATKLFIFEGTNGTIYVPRITKDGGRKVIAFAEKIQEGYDFNRAKTKKAQEKPIEPNAMQLEDTPQTEQPAGEGTAH